MSESRKIVFSSIVVLLGQGLSRGLGVLLLPLLTLIFLPAQFGMSALATSYISFVSVVALLGLDLTYLQAIPGIAKHQADSKIRVIWALTIVLALGAALVGSLAWWLWGKQTPESAPWLALGIFSTMLFSVSQSQMKSDRKYIQLALALSAGGLVMYAWVLWRGFAGYNQAVTLVSGYALGATAAVVISKPEIGITQIKYLPGLQDVWSLVRIGLPAAFTAPVFWVISSMDRWLVAQFWGVAEAGIYSVAASISGMGLLFGAVVQTIWLTEASRIHNSGIESAHAILAQRMKEICFLFALAWLGLIAFSDEIVFLFAKPPFNQSIQYLPWLISSVMLYGLFQALCVFLIIRNKFEKSLIIWLFGGILFVILSIVAAQARNSVGIAVAQVAVYVCMLLWVFKVVRRDAGLLIRPGLALLLIAIILIVGVLLAATGGKQLEMSHLLIKIAVVGMLILLVARYFKEPIGNIFSGRPHA